MSDHTHDQTTYVERERLATPRSTGGSSIAFIVGGLVVAVIVLALLFVDFGGDTVPATVNIDNTSEAPLAPAADPEAVPPQAEATPLPEAAPADDGAAPAADAN